jgi:RNA recognition motif-containing protein
MAKTIFIGNLSYIVTDSDLREWFQQYGTVNSVQIIKDRDTGRSRGFGFVEMAKDHEAQAAIAALNGQKMYGRAVTVNEAKPRPETARGWARPGRRRIA